MVVMFEIEVQRAFTLSRLPKPSQPGDWQGELERITVRLQVCCHRIGENGKTVEFSLLEQVLDKIVREFEGNRLHSMDLFSGQSPSLELLAQFIFRKAEILLDFSSAQPSEVVLEVAKGIRIAYRP